MKARVKSNNRIIEVEKGPIRYKAGKPSVQYYIERQIANINSFPAQNFYLEEELDFTLSEPEEEVKKIHGWVAIDEAYDSCFLHTSKPHQESQEIADTGDYNTVWESDGETYLLDKGLFPNMDSDSDPIEYEVTIKTKKK